MCVMLANLPLLIHLHVCGWLVVVILAMTAQDLGLQLLEYGFMICACPLCKDFVRVLLAKILCASSLQRFFRVLLAQVLCVCPPCKDFVRVLFAKTLFWFNMYGRQASRLGEGCGLAV